METPRPIRSLVGQSRLMLLAGAALLIAGCASLQTVAPPVTPAMVTASGGAAQATLEEGRRIFAGACTACHAADPVSKYSLAEWRDIVDDMADRTKLYGARKDALLAYIAAAKATPPATAAAH